MTESPVKSGSVGRSILLIVMMLVAGGAAGAALLALGKEPPRREVTTLAPLVESMVVRAEEVVEHFIGYGSVRPIRSTDVAAEISANVVERVGDIRAGSIVEKGQVLLRLDNRQYQHALERAEAFAAAERAALDELAVEADGLGELIKTTERELRVARDERTRVAALFEQELAAKKEYDFANLAYQQARRLLQEYELRTAGIVPRRARLSATLRGLEEEAALAQLNIERCSIQAPFAGHIESLLVEVGSRVAPGSVVLKLVDPYQVEIPIQLPAAAYNQVAVGTACRLETESIPGRNWRGGVARIGPVVDDQTRTFSLYVTVDNTTQSHALVPGMFVTARVRGPIHHAGILVPRGACRGGRVFVIEGGIARRRSVVAERFIEDRVLITGEVKSGDRVILSRLDLLADGSPVRTNPDRAATADPQPASVSADPDSSP